MKSDSTGRIRLSAGDLSGHLGCRHLTILDLAVARGELEPSPWRDPAVAVLQERGFAHEQAYVEHLRSRGLSVLEVGADAGFDSGAERTREAMRSGVDAIVQAVLASDRWVGRADVLLRVPGKSALGNWSYEIVDTKLSAETRGGTILQLCLYSELLATTLGRLPERMHVVAPGCDFEPQSFRTADYLAYYRLVRSRLEAIADADDPVACGGGYPEPVAHCDVCAWWRNCDARRRSDDHLSLVAGISRLQQRELQARNVATLERLARMPLPMKPKPARGSAEAYAKVREQARVQAEGRRNNALVHELLPPEAGRGLARLPKPSPGDVFFDLEGDPFVEGGGLEFLFGWATLGARRRPVWMAV